MSEPFTPRWPLAPEPQILLDELAHVLGRLGAWRFLCAPAASSRVDDDAERDAASAAGVARVLARTMWHAYLDLDLRVVPSVDVANGLARADETSLLLLDADERAVRIAIERIGRDDVAVAACYEIGRAALALAPEPHPFRVSGGDARPDLAHAIIAAVAMGLGPLAAGGLPHGGDLDATGLDPYELAFLLAVQSIVREVPQAALATLPAAQDDALEAWRAALAGHGAELRALLGIDDEAARVAMTRGDEPRAPRVEAPDDAWLLRTGRTYRAPLRLGAQGGILGGLIRTSGGVLVAAALGPLGFVGGAALGVLSGWTIGRRMRRIHCAVCGTRITRTMTRCYHCGRVIAGAGVE